MIKSSDTWIKNLRLCVDNISINHTIYEDWRTPFQKQETKIKEVNTFYLISRLISARISYKEIYANLEEFHQFIEKVENHLRNDDKMNKFLNFREWVIQLRLILLGLEKEGDFKNQDEHTRNQISKSIEIVFQDKKMLKMKTYEAIKRYALKELTEKGRDNDILLETGSMKTQDEDEVTVQEDKTIKKRVTSLYTTFFEEWEFYRKETVLKLSKMSFFQSPNYTESLQTMFLPREIQALVEDNLKLHNSPEMLLPTLETLSQRKFDLEEDKVEKYAEMYIAYFQIDSSTKAESNFFEQVSSFFDHIKESNIEDPHYFQILVDKFNNRTIGYARKKLISLTSNCFGGLFSLMKEIKSLHSSSLKLSIVHEKLSKAELKKSNNSDKRLRKDFVKEYYSKFCESYEKYHSSGVKVKDSSFETKGILLGLRTKDKITEFKLKALIKKRTDKFTKFLADFEKYLLFSDQIINFESFKYTKSKLRSYFLNLEDCFEKILTILFEYIKESSQNVQEVFIDQMILIAVEIDRILTRYSHLPLPKTQRAINSIIQYYSFYFVSTKFERLKTDYLSQNWLSYFSFSRTKKPNNKFKVIESHPIIKYLTLFITKEQELYKGYEDLPEQKNWNPKFFLFSFEIFLVKFLKLVQMINPSMKRQSALDDDLYLIYKYGMKRFGDLDFDNSPRISLKMKLLVQFLQFYAESFNPFNSTLEKDLDVIIESFKRKKVYVRKFPQIIKMQKELLKEFKKARKRAKKFKSRSSIFSQTDNSGVSLPTSNGHILDQPEEQASITFERIKASEFATEKIFEFFENEQMLDPNFVLALSGQEESQMTAIHELPRTKANILDFLINLTPGKKINHVENPPLERLSPLKKIDIILQRPELMEEDKDLKPKNLELKKKLIGIAQHIHFE